LVLIVVMLHNARYKQRNSIPSVSKEQDGFLEGFGLWASYDKENWLIVNRAGP